MREADRSRAADTRSLPELDAWLRRCGRSGFPRDAVSAALRRLLPSPLASRDRAALHRLRQTVETRWGPQAAGNLLQRLEVACGWRRPRLALYDHTLQLVGGGQKYGCTMAHILREWFDVTFVSHRPVTAGQLGDWYGLDLADCAFVTVPLPLYGDSPRVPIDPNQVTVRQENPFHAVARLSGRFDFFVNNSMLEMVLPLAPVSVFVCHFPERRRSAHFYADRYDQLVYNSRYTAEWIRRKWQVEPTCHIYPPVDMAAPDSTAAKEPLILSAARFEVGGSKQQDRMVEAFRRLRRRFPGRMAGWKLVLAGGSVADNPYLRRLQAALTAEDREVVEIRVNIAHLELAELYRRAALFWHFCGLGQDDPARVEHFGMTIVEAMQNGCVPVVFDGGGQREIVAEGVSGFRFATLDALLAHSARLIADPNLRTTLAAGARRRGAEFSRDVFAVRVRGLFSGLLRQYAEPAEET